MRLVAWNMNYNNNRRTFEENCDLLLVFDADILVLSEVAPPANLRPGFIEWMGNGPPGLAVVAQHGLSLCPAQTNSGAPANQEHFTAFNVVGRVMLELFAAWPIVQPYHQVLMDGLTRFASTTSKGPRILAGDLNSSCGVSGQVQTHPQFVAHAASFGLASVYHHMTEEVSGTETHPTYFCASLQQRPFHIDYCLASADLIHSASLGIHRGQRWRSLSSCFAHFCGRFQRRTVGEKGRLPCSVLLTWE